MRYRIGDSVTHPGITATEHMVLFTVVLSLAIGVVLFGLSLYGRQRWLTFWSASLVLAALIYLVAMLLGYA